MYRGGRSIALGLLAGLAITGCAEAPPVVERSFLPAHECGGNPSDHRIALSALVPDKAGLLGVPSYVAYGMWWFEDQTIVFFKSGKEGWRDVRFVDVASGRMSIVSESDAGALMARFKDERANFASKESALGAEFSGGVTQSLNNVAAFFSGAPGTQTYHYSGTFTDDGGAQLRFDAIETDAPGEQKYSHSYTTDMALTVAGGTRRFQIPNCTVASLTGLAQVSPGGDYVRIAVTVFNTATGKSVTTIQSCPGLRTMVLNRSWEKAAVLYQPEHAEPYLSITPFHLDPNAFGR